MANELFTYVVYFNPSDFPGRYVMRGFACVDGEATPSAIAISGETIEKVRAHIPEGLHRMVRMPDDDPTIVEVWI